MVHIIIVIIIITTNLGAIQQENDSWKSYVDYPLGSQTDESVGGACVGIIGDKSFALSNRPECVLREPLL